MREGSGGEYNAVGCVMILSGCMAECCILGNVLSWDGEGEIRSLPIDYANHTYTDVCITDTIIVA